MVSSITPHPYFIPRSLRFISSTNPKIANPPSPTELRRISNANAKIFRACGALEKVWEAPTPKGWKSMCTRQNEMYETAGATVTYE